MQNNMTKGLMEALGKWQEVKPPVDLDGNNPHFKSKYATLANIIKTVQPILAQCGLTYVQAVQGGNIITVLMHPKSEGVMVSERPIPEYTKVQDEGSFITYQKRYQLSALLGIATDSDTDGNGVEKQKATALPKAIDAQIENAITGGTKGMASGNRQVIDLVLAGLTVDSAQVRRLVEAEYRHFPDRLTAVVLLLEELGYVVTQSTQK
jgi:hypothetical protein